MSVAMPAFDTLKYVHTLKAAGVAEVQAEAQAYALAGAFDAHHARLATKDDLRQVATELRGEIAKLDGKIDKIDEKSTQKFNHLNWMFGVMVAGLVAVLLRVYFP